jgi:HK97 family phage major capsid protein
VRQLARVESITTDQWKGVTSDGVTAGYAAEAAEASDNSPTLAQPVADTARGQAFIPFSIEVGQDWSSLAEEMGRLLRDGRDQVDATQMLTGNGSNAPIGVLAIGTSGSLTTTQRQQTAGTASFAVADVYSVMQALPARFRPDAAVVGHPSTFDTVYRFVGGGSTEPPLLPTREGPLLGVPKAEWSTMDTGTTSAKRLLVVGDWKNYLIADRIGASIELIPHLFGGSGRPTGQRGFYLFWRTGTVVLVPNAFRYLEVK